MPLISSRHSLVRFEISGKIIDRGRRDLFPIACRRFVVSGRSGSGCRVDMRRGTHGTLWHVKLRVAARQICGGIRVSAAYIFATAATAEYLGAQAGPRHLAASGLQLVPRAADLFSATLVIIVITGMLMCLVNLS